MMTQTHLILGLTAFGKANQTKVTAAALAGAMLPDLSLYLMAGTHLFVLGTAPEIVFGQLYFSEAWHSIFRIDNSLVLWGIALVLAVMWRAPVVIALCGAAVLHILLDFPLHHDDGRAHFWPMTTWIFESPVSYWDADHFGHVVGPLEVALALGCCVILWRRFVGLWMRVLICVLGALEMVSGIAFVMRLFSFGG